MTLKFCMNTEKRGYLKSQKFSVILSVSEESQAGSSQRGIFLRQLADQYDGYFETASSGGRLILAASVSSFISSLFTGIF